MLSLIFGLLSCCTEFKNLCQYISIHLTLDESCFESGLIKPIMATTSSIYYNSHSSPFCFSAAMPSIPLNLTLVHNPPLYYKEAEISWSPGNPHEPLTDYIIVNRAEGSDTKAVTRIDPEYTSFTLKDLKEKTKYVVYVKAAIGNDHSEGSSKLEFNTQSKST